MLSAENQSTDNRPEELIVLNGDRKSGAEHNVWLDRVNGLVRKIPSAFGKVWQKMHPDYAERDFGIQRESELSPAITEIKPYIDVSYAGRNRERVNYLLNQPAYEPSHPLSYADILFYQKFREYLLEAMRKGREIREKYNIGLDLLGGKIVKLFGPVLDPRRKSMPAEINNLLVADDVIITKKDWPAFGVKKGEPIAQKGDIILCDTRMYDFNRQGFTGNAIKKVLLAGQDAQDCANWSLLEHFGLKAEFDFEMTRVRRMVRYLMRLAIPKMQAYAEGVG